MTKMHQLESIKLETERLVLRALTLEDEEAVFGIYSDMDVMKYWSCPPYTERTQARELILSAQEGAENGSSLSLALEERESGLLLGTFTLFNFHMESRRAELGYILGRESWGKGFMIEALSKLINFSFSELNLNRLEADIDPDNHASAKLLKKLGFLLEGRLTQRWIVDGHVTDSEIYGLVRANSN